MDSQQDITALRARVEKLGCKLLENDEDQPERGYYIQLADGRIDVAYSNVYPSGISEWLDEQEGSAAGAVRRAADRVREDDDEPVTDRAQTDAEYARRELSTVQDVITEVIHVARLGQADNEDPATAFRAIERIANEAFDVLHGEAWDRIGAALERGDNAARLFECLRRQAAIVVRDRKKPDVAAQLDALDGWLAACDDQLGKLEQ